MSFKTLKHLKHWKGLPIKSKLWKTKSKLGKSKLFYLIWKYFIWMERDFFLCLKTDLLFIILHVSALQTFLNVSDDIRKVNKQRKTL